MMKIVLHLSLLIIVFILSGCKPSPADKVAMLPELPANLLAALDTATLATRIPTPVPEPIPDTMGVALAPCCAIRVDRTLQVSYPYTKCRPLRDFTAVDLDNLPVLERSDAQPEQPAGVGSEVGASSATAYYRLPARDAAEHRSAWDQIICTTRSGPWSAVLSESRTCQNYSPRFTLIITPDDVPLTFQWTGDIAGHPADIGLISCRLNGEVRTPCSGLSTCECHSSACPETDPCSCGIAEIW